MTHNEHIELIELLKKLAGDIDILRVVFERVKNPEYSIESIGEEPKTVPSDRARQHPVFKTRYSLLMRSKGDADRAVEIMDRCVDSWTESNQARKDQGHPVTFDDRALYGAMSKFMSATKNPFPRAKGLFVSVRDRCRSWMDQATTWFPDLYPDEIRKILEDDHYKKAVDEGKIIPPFTWTKGIKELSSWIDDNCFVSDPVAYQVTGGKNRWSRLDCVFKQLDGTPITSKQLGDLNKH